MTLLIHGNMHIQVDVEKKNILIIGWPASGKTFLANKLWKDNPSHKCFHTDDYMHHGYKEALYVLMADLKKCKQPTIVEGVQGYRLLRKGAELDCYYPDIVIEIEIAYSRMMQTYLEERRGKDPAYLKGFNKMHSKILDDYFNMMKLKPKIKRPHWIKLKNHY